MACCDTLQLLDPQVLGVRGDVAYDEYGSLALAIGQTSAAISFIYEKATTAYRFEYLYIEDAFVSSPSDDDSAGPQDIRAVVTYQDELGFTLNFSGAPTTTTCTLRWHVMRPDPLQINQPATTGPLYAIVRPSQKGITALVSGQDYINVTFPHAQADNDWVFEALTIENQTDPQLASQIFSWTVSVHTITGFRLDLSGTPDNNFYILRWKVS